MDPHTAHYGRQERVGSPCYSRSLLLKKRDVLVMQHCVSLLNITLSIDIKILKHQILHCQMLAGYMIDVKSMLLYQYDSEMYLSNVC